MAPRQKPSATSRRVPVLAVCVARARSPKRTSLAQCLRHNREPLDLTAAAVLHRALTRPPEERAREALHSPAEHAAAERLIAAGLLEDHNGVLRPTPRAEATFRAPPDRRHLR